MYCHRVINYMHYIPILYTFPSMHTIGSLHGQLLSDVVHIHFQVSTPILFTQTLTNPIRTCCLLPFQSDQFLDLTVSILYVEYILNI